MEDCVEYTEDFIMRLAHPDLIAVVMNGPVDEDYGDEIDGCPSVFRFNIFKTEGFQKKVGCRTDFWIVNGDSSVGETRKQLALCPFPETKYRKEIIDGFKKTNYILYTKKKYTDYAKDNINYPTTGYTFLLMMLRIYSGKMFVYGFNGLRKGHYFNGSHCHASKHSGDLEYKDISENYKDRIIIK